jgi:hypothetical protein
VTFSSDTAGDQAARFIVERSGRVDIKQFNAKIQDIANELKQVVSLSDTNDMVDDEWAFIPDDRVMASQAEIDDLKRQFSDQRHERKTTAAESDADFADMQMTFNSYEQTASVRIRCGMMRIKLGAYDSARELELLEERIPTAFTLKKQSPFQEPSDFDPQNYKFPYMVLLDTDFVAITSLVINWQWSQLPPAEKRLIKWSTWRRAYDRIDSEMNEDTCTVKIAVLIWAGPKVFISDLQKLKAADDDDNEDDEVWEEHEGDDDDDQDQHNEGDEQQEHQQEEEQGAAGDEEDVYMNDIE